MSFRYESLYVIFPFIILSKVYVSQYLSLIKRLEAENRRWKILRSPAPFDCTAIPFVHFSFSKSSYSILSLHFFVRFLLTLLHKDVDTDFSDTVFNSIYYSIFIVHTLTRMLVAYAENSKLHII